MSGREHCQVRQPAEEASFVLSYRDNQARSQGVKYSTKTHVHEFAQVQHTHTHMHKHARACTPTLTHTALSDSASHILSNLPHPVFGFLPCPPQQHGPH